MSKKLAILVDGSGFIYRAFFALPALTRADGKPVGAVYGFCTMLLSLIDKHKSDLFCVAFDSSRVTFRTSIYDQYKANREEPPDDLKVQFPILRDVCKAFGVHAVEKQGFEADDIIATYAADLSARGYSVRIISSDKDLMQLVNEDVTMFDPIKSKIIKIADVEEKYGVPPSKMIYLQALMGDKSDNVPGVMGIGPKTATILLNQFKDLDDLYANIEKVNGARIKEKLLTYREDAEISLRLVTLCKDADVEKNYENFTIDYDEDRIAKFFEEYGFESLKKRIHKPVTKMRKQMQLLTARDIKNFFELNRVEKLSFFVSSISRTEYAIALCTPQIIGYCPFSIEERKADLFSQPSCICADELYEVLAPYFADAGIKKIGLKRDSLCYDKLIIKNYDDIALMAYLLFGPPMGDKVSDVLQCDGDPLAECAFSAVTTVDKICRLAELIFDHYDICAKQLEQNDLVEIYQKIDLPLLPILAEMERVGIKLSVEKLLQMDQEVSEEAQAIQEKIFKLCGGKFNIASVKQLKEILFERLNIPKPHSKSLDVENLEELSIYSPVPNLVIEWRKLRKLSSTYTSPLVQAAVAAPKDHRVHTTFNMTATLTGRLSSSNPNLQNIPARTPLGKQIKNSFISEKGRKLVSFDYSQIELRVLAHLADIDQLKHAFKNGIDVHSATAAKIFDVDLAHVDSDMRGKAKTINFGILYGMSAFRLSRMLNISPAQAKRYIENYFASYPEFEKFHDKVLQFAEDTGYVKTLMGRRCYIRGLHSKNAILRQFSRRQAFNAVLQGTAADIVKIAMIKIFDKLKNLHSSMLLQIHDELVFETEDAFVEQVISEISDIMQNAVQLSVPLIVNTKYGDYLE